MSEGLGYFTCVGCVRKKNEIFKLKLLILFSILASGSLTV